MDAAATNVEEEDVSKGILGKGYSIFDILDILLFGLNE